MTKEERENAKTILDSLYLDCKTPNDWDTEDPENWQSMRDGIEQLAKYLKIKLERKKV